MNRGFSKSEKSSPDAGSPVERKNRIDRRAVHNICGRRRNLCEGSFKMRNIPIMISVVALLFLILPACAKADFNQNASLENDQKVNQSAYISAFNEGYYLGGLFVLAQNNATLASQYNFLVQKHNDFLNKTLSEEDAESNLLAKVSMPSSAPRKPVDPWEL